MKGAVGGSLYSVGMVVGVLAFSALITYRVWEEWVMVITGLITIALPWLAGFSGNLVLTLNALACGVVIVALSAWMARAHPKSAIIV